MKKLWVIIGLLCCFWALFSCDAKVNVSLKANQSGIAELSVKLDPMLSQYIFDLQSSFTKMSADEAKRFIEPEAIRQAFASSKSVTVKEVQSSADSLLIKLAFSDLNEIVSEGETKMDAGQKQEVGEVFHFADNPDGTKRVSFRLDKAKTARLLAMVPPEYQQLVKAIEPPGYDVDKEDYLDMLALNFIEYDPDYMKQKIRTAKFVFSFDIAGQILNYKGGKKVGNQIVYEIPLLDLLVMNDAYFFEVSFR